MKIYEFMRTGKPWV